MDLVSVLEVPHRPTAGPDAATGVDDGPRSDLAGHWGVEADAPTASPVWWPSPPSTLRRVAAWVVDVVVIIGASLAVALTQARTFQPAGGLSPRHRALLERVEESRSVVVTTGDTVRTWSGAGLWITVTSFALIALIVLALLPANLGGRTPGMAAARLRVVATAGTPARLEQHLLRTAVGLVDLLPGIVPGLLGFVLMARTGDGRRLGDRVAGTQVVARNHLEPLAASLATPTTQRPRSDQPDEPRLSSSAEPADVQLPPTLATTIEPHHPPSTEPADVQLPPTLATTIEPARTEVRPVSEVAPPVRHSKRVVGAARPLASVPAPVGRSQRPTSDRPPVSAVRERATRDYDIGGDRPAASAPRGDQVADVEWSGEHEAWTVLDPVSGRRLRHDADSDRWVLIE